MASYTIRTSAGIGGIIQDKNRVVSSNDPALSSNLFTASQSITLLDTYLNGFNSSLYTQAMLDSMNNNDKIYAYRLSLGNSFL